MNNLYLMYMLIYMFDFNICEVYVVYFVVNMVYIEWMLFLVVVLE